MRYLLLLRGVNSGGRNKVDMPELKRNLESVGSPEVETYLYTGSIHNPIIYAVLIFEFCPVFSPQTVNSRMDPNSSVSLSMSFSVW